MILMKMEKPNFESKTLGELLLHNKEKLNVDMMHLINDESLGGNASWEVVDSKKYSCAAANGYANKKTGEIITFSNDPLPLTEGIARFTLRIAIDLNVKAAIAGKSFMKIVNFIGAKNFSEGGEETIKISIEEWNEKHAIITPIE